MRLSHDAMHALSAEYVVGTLRGRARRRFEALVKSDRTLRAILDQWEGQLTPLAEKVEAVDPPARVWREIESRIAASKAEAEGAAGFWRTIGLLASGFAVVLAVAFLWFSPARDADPDFVAVLTASDSVPRVVVSMHSSSELRVRVVNPWKGTEGKSLELWALPKGGAPRSLGLVENERETRIRMASADARLASAAAFAVSLEPRGGSTTGQPTGPVLCSGAIAAPRKA